MKKKTISKLQLIAAICSIIIIIVSFIAKSYLIAIFFGLMLVSTILASPKSKNNY